MNDESPVLIGVDAIHVATVFEDCVDQLAILGRIMPPSFQMRHDVSEVFHVTDVTVLSLNQSL